MSPSERGEAVHANCVVVGDCGVLIRGPSGSGKSLLSRRLVHLAHKEGQFGRLVGDDRVFLRAIGGRLIATGHPRIAGLIEVRGIGIAETDFENQAVIRLLVDCEPVLKVRVPENSGSTDTLFCVSIWNDMATPESADLVLAALGLASVLI